MSAFDASGSGKRPHESVSQRMAAAAVGLDLYRAKNRLLRSFPELDADSFDVTYVECGQPRGTVMSCERGPEPGSVRLSVASQNPVRHLPVNYQDNDFLRNFLMVFQHIANDTSITLDNIHNYFNPMECPTSFLPLLADWFGINLDTLGGAEEIRRFLRYAIPLYRYRGTALGLRAHLAIVTGVVPEIVEGYLPFDVLEIEDGKAVDSSLFEAGIGENCFTVLFPVERSRFGENLVKRVSLIVQQEKPAHARCFVSYKKPEMPPRAVTVLDSQTMMGADSGMTF